MRKIFVGSSSEALKVAELVGEIVKEAHMVPIVWNTMFPAGDILLEKIETLPNEVDGAVLLVTPDVRCRRGKQSFDVPVANVVFEYGYLAARLTRQRVAICSFDGATIPSDLKGMTVVRAGNYEKGDLSHLPEDAKRKLRDWLERLPPLADEMSPVHRVHGYSGRWRVESRFSRWKNHQLRDGETIHFHGTTFLLLSLDGKKGSGTQTGKLFIDVGNYHATYEIANRVNSATFAQDGKLDLSVEVLTRTGIEEEGEPPEEWFRERMYGSKEFYVKLEPAPGEPKKLPGTHTYTVANRVYQEAEENWEYLGF